MSASFISSARTSNTRTHSHTLAHTHTVLPKKTKFRSPTCCRSADVVSAHASVCVRVCVCAFVCVCAQRVSVPPASCVRFRSVCARTYADLRKAKRNQSSASHHADRSIVFFSTHSRTRVIAHNTAASDRNITLRSGDL